jgi:hypothetical protein
MSDGKPTTKPTEYEGGRTNMLGKHNRNAQVGDKVRIVADSVDHEIPIGTEVTITHVGYKSVIVNYASGRFVHEDDFELVTGDKTLELIASLSAEIVRLSKRVEALEGNQAPAITIHNTYGKPPQVIAQELSKTILERFKANTVMLTREDIIEKAKRDVEDLIAIGSDRTRDLPKESPLNDCFYRVESVTNSEKRTVVVLIRYLYGETIRGRGIAKCAPDDCFNVHIGKAIALRRALGLDIPKEYVN